MASRTTGTTSRRTSTETTGGGATTTTLSGANVLRNCANVCFETFNYCIQQGGEHVSEDHLRSLVDCAELCNVTANFVARESDVADDVLEACATACKNCQETCEQFEDDTTMRGCEVACREALEFCNR